MAKNPSISTIATGYYSRNALNTNFENLRDGFSNTLSLDGSTPNAMGADFDMNHNSILNVDRIDLQSMTLGGVNFIPSEGEIATSYASQSYTGDGTTVTYAMGFNPLSKPNVSAYVDGVYQNQDSYGISGTDLTFTEAPPLNSAIEIRVPIAVTSLTNTDASQLVYTQGDTGSVSRSVESRLQDYVSVKDFGAVGDGVTDDTAAWTAAIAWLNSLSSPAILVASGRTVVNGSLPAITTNAKYIDATSATIIHDGGTLFTWGAGTLSSVVDGGILGLNYQGATTPTAGTCIVSQEGMNRLLLKGIRGSNVNQFLKAGLNGYAGGYCIWDVRLTTYNGTAKVIEHGNGANSRIQGLDMTASGVNRVLDQSTPIGATATAIHFGQETWDTAEWSGLLINGYLYGLDINRTALNKTVSNFRVTNFYFDFCSNGMRFLNGATGGGINNMIFTNGWAVGMDGYGVHLDGSVGAHRSISFDNVVALLAGKNNWRLTSQTMDGVTINNCAGLYACRLTTNTGSDQDDFVALFGGWACRNSQFGKSADNIVASGVPNWQGRYGFTGPISAADWVFEGNAIEGRTGSTQVVIGSNTITAGKLFSSSVRNNRVPGGAARVTYATTTAVAAPTSNTLQTNNTPFHFTLHIYGGTVTSIQKNGTEVAASGPVSISISPGDTWLVIYSAAPTIKRIIEQ